MTKIDEALILLHQKLVAVKGDWMIIGTTSLYLSGQAVEPNDIDVLTDTVTAKEMEQLLSKYRVDSDIAPGEKFRSRFSKYDMDGFNVEVMGDLEVNTTAGWLLLRGEIVNPEIIFFNGATFNVPSKTDQLTIYTLFNRGKDQKVLKLLAG